MTKRVEIRSAEQLLKEVDEFGQNADSPEIKRVTSEICKQILNFQEQLTEAARMLTMLGTRLEEGYSPKMELVEVLYEVFNHVRGRLRQAGQGDGGDVAVLLEFTRQFEHIRQGVEQTPELFEPAGSIVPVRGLSDEGTWLEACRKMVESQDELLGVYRDLFAFVFRRINGTGSWDRNVELGRVNRITDAIQEGKMRKEERRCREEEERRRREEEERRCREEEERRRREEEERCRREEERRRREEEERRRREEEERKRETEREAKEEIERKNEEDAQTQRELARQTEGEGDEKISEPQHVARIQSVTEVRETNEAAPQEVPPKIRGGRSKEVRAAKAQGQTSSGKHERVHRLVKQQTRKASRSSGTAGAGARTPVHALVSRKIESRSSSDDIHIPGWMNLIVALGTLVVALGTLVVAFYALKWCWSVAKEIALFGAHHWIFILASTIILVVARVTIRWFSRRSDESVDDLGDDD